MCLYCLLTVSVLRSALSTLIALRRVVPVLTYAIGAFRKILLPTFPEAPTNARLVHTRYDVHQTTNDGNPRLKFEVTTESLRGYDMRLSYLIDRRGDEEVYMILPGRSFCCVPRPNIIATSTAVELYNSTVVHRFIRDTRKRILL